MSRLLRTDLPDDVWERLAAEAAAHNQKIGLYLKNLIIARDRKKHGDRSIPSIQQKGKS